MAKKRGRPSTGRTDVPARVDKALKIKAQRIADYRGISLAQVISEAAEANINREYIRMIREVDLKEGA